MIAQDTLASPTAGWRAYWGHGWAIALTDSEKGSFLYVPTAFERNDACLGLECVSTSCGTEFHRAHHEWHESEVVPAGLETCSFQSKHVGCVGVLWETDLLTFIHSPLP